MHGTLGELKAMLDGLIELYGDDTRIDFVHPVSFRSKPRTRIAWVTGYKVGAGSGRPYVRIDLDHPRGDLVTEQEIAEEKSNG
jgi:hypothetical protein